MLRLCLALAIFYPTFGGGSLRFMRYSPGLRKRDVFGSVLAGTARSKDAFHRAGDDNRSLGWDQVAVGEMLPEDEVEGLPVQRVRLPDQTGIRRTSTYFRALIEHCRHPDTRPDVIQLHSFERLESLYWIWRLKRLGIPVVYAIQIARPARRKSRLLGVSRRWMLRRFYDSFDGVVTSSEQIDQHLRALGVRVPIAVIPNGVDLEKYRPGDAAARQRARDRLGIHGSGPVLLSVGAISPRKGSDLLVEAWVRLLDRQPEAELVLIGPRHDRNSDDLDDFEKRLARLIEASPRPDRVHLPGVRDDLAEIYAAADLVVLPTEREGGTPNVVLEAMACERAVLVTPFEGQSQAIGRPGIEFAQAPRTASALADAMAELLSDDRRRAGFVARGRDWVVRHLDLETSLDRFAEFYRRAADRRLDRTELDRENPRFPTEACPAPSALPARSGAGLR